MTSPSEFNAKELIRSAGLRCTRGRAEILTILHSAGQPLSQAQITQRLENASLDKVTVYRALASFVKAGLVHRAYLCEREWHYELAHHCSERQCHPHFHCTACGQTHCLVNARVPMVRNTEGFVIHRQQVRLEGLCPKCR